MPSPHSALHVGRPRPWPHAGSLDSEHASTASTPRQRARLDTRDGLDAEPASSKANPRVSPRARGLRVGRPLRFGVITDGRDTSVLLKNAPIAQDFESRVLGALGVASARRLGASTLGRALDERGPLEARRSKRAHQCDPSKRAHRLRARRANPSSEPDERTRRANPSSEPDERARRASPSSAPIEASPPRSAPSPRQSTSPPSLSRRSPAERAGLSPKSARNGPASAARAANPASGQPS